MAAALTVHDIEVEDVEYLRFGNTALLARLYKPRGDGPFPLLVDGWTCTAAPGAAATG